MRRTGRAILTVGVVLALAAVDLVWDAAPARACSCMSRPWSLREDEARAAASFIGRRVAVRVEPDPAYPPEYEISDVVYTISVEEVFKGDIAATVEVRTSTNDGLCGVGLGNASVGFLVGIEGNPDVGFEIGLCGGTIDADQLRAIHRPPPATDGRAPPRLVVDLTLGDRALATLDADGRVVAFAPEVDLWSFSVCPGGRVLTGLVGSPGRPWSLGVIDVLTLRFERMQSLDAFDLENRRPGEWRDERRIDGIVCLDADGRRSAIQRTRTWSPYTPEVDVIDASAGRTASIAGAAVRVDPVRGRLLLLSGAERERIVALDLVSGERTEVLSISQPSLVRALAFSPDGSRLALLVADSSSESPRSRGAGALQIVPLDGSEGPAAVQLPRSAAVRSFAWPEPGRLAISWDSLSLVTVLAPDGTVLAERALRSSASPAGPLILGDAVVVTTRDDGIGLAPFSGAPPELTLVGAWFRIVQELPVSPAAPAEPVRLEPAFTG